MGAATPLGLKPALFDAMLSGWRDQQTARRLSGPFIAGRELKRSQEVGSDRGRWHCVTGFCDPGTKPLEQAWQELEEETGLSRRTAHLRGRATPLELLDGRGEGWTVHAFLFATSDPR